MGRYNGKENGNYYIIGLYRGYIGIVEKKMEITPVVPSIIPLYIALYIPYITPIYIYIYLQTYISPI